ncbi:MAG TPA: tripartite tricarboxylate transporter substrate-binding protein [Rubrivivax sp.]|nr:tripartite tricarboxylate transporter substrate-binding protein [Rubrivivax sp.]
MTEVARTDDQHTLILGHTATFAVDPFIVEKLSFDVNKDFKPVSLLAKVPSLYPANPRCRRWQRKRAAGTTCWNGPPIEGRFPFRKSQWRVGARRPQPRGAAVEASGVAAVGRGLVGATNLFCKAFGKHANPAPVCAQCGSWRPLRFTASVVDEQFLLRLQDGKEFIARRRGTGGQLHGDDLVNGGGTGVHPGSARSARLWRDSRRPAATTNLWRR